MDFIKFLICIAVIVWAVYKIKDNKQKKKKAEAEANERARVNAIAAANRKAYLEREVITITDFIFSPKRVPDSILEDLELEVVDLVQEPDNEYDANAVRVEFNDGEEDHVLGYLYCGRLQDEVNRYINSGKHFEAKVESVDTDGDPKRFIEISVDFDK